MNQVYLIGAGFTRAVVGEKAPLTHEIMPKLNISNFPEIRDDFEKAFPDIEQFLSILDLKYLHFQQINKSFADHINVIRQSIIQQVVELVDINNLNIEKLEKYSLLKRIVTSIPNKSYLLTLNYDCVLDQGLYLSNRWSPIGGYNYTNFPITRNENISKDQIIVLKLHGSCNFRDTEDDQPYPTIEINNRIFPGINSDVNAGGNPHVLVMSYIKQFHNGIMSLWREAISVLKEADKLIVIGCSLREEDTFLRFALYHFGMKEKNGKFFIEIIDNGNSSIIEDKIKKLVANPDKQKITCFDEGLESYKI